MSTHPCASVESTVSPRRRRGFTLVELLVVIGIIALLISILLPALNKARQQGNWAKCTSNMKQVAQAFFMYCQEYKGTLPWRSSAGDGPRPSTTAGASFQYATDWIRYQETAAGYGGAHGPVDINESAIANYLGVQNDKLREILRCPTDELEAHPTWAASGKFLYSFSFNSRCTRKDDNSTSSWRKLSEVRRSSEKAMLAEEDKPNDGHWVPGGVDDKLTERHGKRGNIAFFDTHVESMYNAEFTDPNKTFKYPFQE